MSKPIIDTNTNITTVLGNLQGQTAQSQGQQSSESLPTNLQRISSTCLPALRPAFSGPKAARSFWIGPEKALHGIVLSGKAPDISGACAAADLVILAGYADGAAAQGCRLIDRALLRKTGALAIWPSGAGYQITPAARGGRIWMEQKTVPDLPPLEPQERPARIAGQ